MITIPFFGRSDIFNIHASTQEQALRALLYASFITLEHKLLVGTDALLPFLQAEKRPQPQMMSTTKFVHALRGASYDPMYLVYGEFDGI